MSTDCLAEEVTRLVGEAAAFGRLLNAWREAERLHVKYNGQRPVKEIAEMIVRASAGIAGISIELGEGDGAAGKDDSRKDKRR